MSEHLISALLVASWTSIVWAPLAMVATVWMPRYAWHVAAIIGVALTSLFCLSFVYGPLTPVCRSSGGAEVILCQEEGMALALLQLVMVGAAFVTSGFFILGQVMRRNVSVQRVAL